MEKQTIIRGAAIVVAGIAASVMGAQHFLDGGSPSQSTQTAMPSEAPQVVSAGFMSGGTATTTPEAEVTFDESTFMALSNADGAPEAKTALSDFSPQLAAADLSTDPSDIPAQATDCTPQLVAQDTIDALIELSVTAPCHPNERLVISHADLAFSAYTSDAGTYSAYLPALSETARIDVFIGDTEFLQAEVAVPEASDHYRVALQWTGDAGFGLHAYHQNADFGSEGHLHALKPFDSSLEEAFLISLGEKRGPEPMLAEIYSIPAGLAQVNRIELELQFEDGQCGQELSAYVLQSGAGIATEIKEARFETPPCPSDRGFMVLALPVLAPQHAQMQPTAAPVVLDLME